MSVLTDWLKLSDADKKAKGLSDTPREIAQQPECWKKTVAILKSQKKDIKAFLRKCKIPRGAKTRMILCGAGTSEFIGHAVEGVMRRGLEIDVDSRATTDVVTYFKNIFVPNRNYVVLSFARSGNSPESIGTFDIVK